MKHVSLHLLTKYTTALVSAPVFFSTSVLGGFRAQGRTAVKARQVLDDALAVQDAGAFAVVVECVPTPVAKAVTAALEIPTIGIGAGAFTSGQVGMCSGKGDAYSRNDYYCCSSGFYGVGMPLPSGLSRFDWATFMDALAWKSMMSY